MLKRSTGGMKAGWMLLAAFFFATMGVCVKMASASFNPAELVFYRGLIGMAVMVALARARRIPLTTRYPGMHAWRSMVGVTSLTAWFYAIAHLPLATAVTLNYMSSVWIAAFLVGGTLMAWRPGAGHDRPPLQGALVLTVLTGFAGVVMMLRPTIDPQQMLAGVVGLFSGVTAAFAYMQVMALSRAGEPEARTVFYFAVGSAVTGLAGMALVGVSPWSWKAALWLPPLGLLASGGQYCMTRAYATAGNHRGTLVVANLQYTGIVFAAGYGVLLFGDTIAPIAWAGMATIIASGVAATVLRGRTPAPGDAVRRR